MTEETFFKQISPIADHDFFYYVAADFSLGTNACSRAYINFTNKDDIFIFKDKFDGYIFIDGKGVEYPAVVEFAPFQGLPKIRSRKKDNKCGTIEEDPHFISFLESLNNVEPEIGGKTETKLEYSYKLKDDKKITSTPLLEFLANKKHDRREDKKRKGDDKRKQRDDDRQKKRGQVSRNMPSSIKEEEKDDGIVVKTIKSQSMDKNRPRRKEHSFELPLRNPVKSTEDEKKRGGIKEDRDRDRDRDRRKNDSRDVKKKTEREREKERKFEKDRERYFERERERNLERERKEKEKEKLKPIIEKEKLPDKEIEKKIDNIEPEIKPETPKPSVKREVKKYSEVRKERRARAESRQTETSTVKSEEDPKTEIKEDEFKKPEPVINIKSVSTEKEFETEKPRNRRSEGSRRKDKDDRVDRRIKNKDRPAMQIYRPGKRRDDNTDGENGCTTPTDQKPVPFTEKEKDRERKISFKNRSRRNSRTDEKFERKKSESEIVFKNEPSVAPSIVEAEN